MKILMLLCLVTFSYAQVMGPNNCLEGQDLNAEDVDISRCPEIAGLPGEMIWIDGVERVSLGAWELGTTAEGDVYKYGTLNEASAEPRILTYYQNDGQSVVDEINIECWAKGYYRLRHILKNPPQSYITLRDAGFQFRFFQFQTDLRYGQTGYKKISSFRDHLVKWVTLVTENGKCIQPTRDAFVNYAKAEVARRGL